MSLDEYQRSLAWKIVNYQKDTDPYEFNDCYESEIDAFNETLGLLGSPTGIKDIIKVFKNDLEHYNSILDYSDDKDFIKHEIVKTDSLMREIIDYSKDLKEMDILRR